MFPAESQGFSEDPNHTLSDGGRFQDAKSYISDESPYHDIVDEEVSVNTQLWFEAAELSDAEIHGAENPGNPNHTQAEEWISSHESDGGTALYMSVAAVGHTISENLTTPLAIGYASTNDTVWHQQSSPPGASESHLRRKHLRSYWRRLTRAALGAKNECLLHKEMEDSAPPDDDDLRGIVSKSDIADAHVDQPTAQRSKRAVRRSRRKVRHNRCLQACFLAWWKWSTWRVFAAVAILREHQRARIALIRRTLESWRSLRDAASHQPAVRLRGRALSRARHALRAWRQLCATAGAAGAARLRAVVWRIILLRLFIAWKIENLAFKIRTAAFEVLACWAERFLAAAAVNAWRCAVAPALRPFRVWAGAALRSYTRVCRRFQLRARAQTVVQRARVARGTSAAGGWRRAAAVCQLQRRAGRRAARSGLGRWSLACGDRAFLESCEAAARRGTARRRTGRALRDWRAAAEACRAWRGAADAASASAAARRGLRAMRAWREWATADLRARLFVSERRAAAEEQRARSALLALRRVALSAAYGRACSLRPALLCWKYAAQTRRYIARAVKVSLEGVRARCRHEMLLTWGHRARELARLRKARVAVAQNHSACAAREAIAGWVRAMALHRADSEVEAAAARGGIGRLRARALRAWRTVLEAARLRRRAEHCVLDRRRSAARRGVLASWCECARRRLEADARGWASRARRALLGLWTAATFQADIRASLSRFLSSARRATATSVFAAWRRAARTRGVLTRCAALMWYAVSTRHAFRRWGAAWERAVTLQSAYERTHAAAAAATQRRSLRRLEEAVRGSAFVTAAVRLHTASLAARSLREWHVVAAWQASSSRLIARVRARRAGGLLLAGLIGWAAAACRRAQLSAATAAAKVLIRRSAARQCLQALAALCCAGSAWNRRILRATVVAWHTAQLREHSCAVGCERRQQVLITLLDRRYARIAAGVVAVWVPAARMQGAQRAAAVKATCWRGGRLRRAAMVAWCEEAARAVAFAELMGAVRRRFKRSSLARAMACWRYWTGRLGAAAVARAIQDERLVHVALVSWHKGTGRKLAMHAGALRCAALCRSLRCGHVLAQWAGAANASNEWRSLCKGAAKIGDLKRRARALERWSGLPRVAAVERLVAAGLCKTVLGRWRYFASKQSAKRSLMNIIRCRADGRLVAARLNFWALWAERVRYLHAAYDAVTLARRRSVLAPALRAWSLWARYRAMLSTAARCFRAGRLAAAVRAGLGRWSAQSLQARRIRLGIMWVQQCVRQSQMAGTVDVWAAWTAAGARNRFATKMRGFFTWKSWAGLQLYWRAAMRPISGAYLRWLCMYALRKWAVTVVIVPSQMTAVALAAVERRQLYTCFACWRHLLGRSAELHRRGLWLLLRCNARCAANFLAGWQTILTASYSTLANRENSETKLAQIGSFINDGPRKVASVSKSLSPAQNVISLDHPALAHSKSKTESAGRGDFPNSHFNSSGSKRMVQREQIVFQPELSQAPVAAVVLPKAFAPYCAKISQATALQSGIVADSADSEQYREIKYGAAWLAPTAANSAIRTTFSPRSMRAYGDLTAINAQAQLACQLR